MAAKRRGPAVARRQLRLRLRRARFDARMTQSEVANALEWAPSKILRLENGQNSVSNSDLLALLTQYPDLDREREELLKLAREARRPTFENQYSDVLPDSFRIWVAFEAYADAIQQYEPQVVPGILQTDEYATGLVKAQLDDEVRADRIVEARLQRSEPLVGGDGPIMNFIIDETALIRAADRRDAQRDYPTMIAQLEHLKKLNTIGRQGLGEAIDPDLNPRISIQIVPLTLGPYTAMRHPFELIEFEDEDNPFMMYFEGPDSDQVIRDRYDEIERYINRFSELKRQLADPVDTNAQIDHIIDLMAGDRNAIISSSRTAMRLLPQP